MNNQERFKRAINWEPIDRILTYDYSDCGPLLEQLGGGGRGRGDRRPAPCRAGDPQRGDTQ